MTASAHDASLELQAGIEEAIARGRSLFLRGGGSKSAYIGQGGGNALDTSSHRGITAYEPTELVITARAGTPLSELEAALAEHGQLLPFEPPHFSGAATIGGAIASGLSGPRRFSLGSARDAVLGIECINGKAERLRFGGVVMKNVAGYDLARLLTGSMGQLACLLEISLKVLPAPEQEQTRVLQLDEDSALELVHQLTAEAIPVSATAWLAGQLHLRLSGPARVLDAAAKRIGGEVLADGARFWQDLRDHQLPFFQESSPLWRLNLPPHTLLPNPGQQRLSEHGGQQIWLHGTDMDALMPDLTRLGGHARLVRNDGSASTHDAAPTPALAALLQRIKHSFDPDGIFTSARYPGEL